MRITCCTICGSDLHTFNGHRDGPTPSILGHEIIGIVESLSDANVCDVAGEAIQVGDRVTWSVACSCHDCHRCNNDMPQKCESLFKYGHEPLVADVGPSGGLAEYCLLRAGTAIVLLPADVRDEVLCPANCATATVAAAMRAAGSLENKRVLILGAGMLGLTASAFANTLNASEICVSDVDAVRLKRAKDFGATRTLLGISDAEFDVIFEMSGSPDAVETAIHSASVGGIVVLVGSVFPSRSVAVDPEGIVRRLLSIHGVHNYRPDDLSNAVQFLLEHHSRFPFASLVDNSFPLTEVNEAFSFATEHRPIRVAIVP